jgi:hypothetical protein
VSCAARPLVCSGKGYGVMLNFIPRSPDAELVIRAIEPKGAAQADA